MSFSDLKKKKGSAGLTDLQNKLEELDKKDGKKFEKDPRFWSLKRGKDGVGAAVIRFLPASEGETDPFVRLLEYSFKGPGGWYIEKSLQNISRKDPVNDLFSELWNSGIEANKERAKKLKRRTIFISNILVLKDPANPENEGKIFLFQYGKQIFDMINSAMFPEQDELDEDVKEGVNVFCPWEGASLKLRIKTVDKIPNYLSSEFSSPSPLFGGDDAKIEALWKEQYPLAEFTDPEKYKSYENLQKRLDRVLCLSLPNKAKKSAPSSVEDVQSVATLANKTEEAAEDVKESELEQDTDDDEDADLSYLQSIVGEQD